MDALKKLVIEVSTLTEVELREARETVDNSDADPAVRSLVIDVIDLYLRMGEDLDQRARAASACLLALDHLDATDG